MVGTHSTLEASAQLAFTNGLTCSVYRAADGRRIRSGTCSHEIDVLGCLVIALETAERRELVRE